MDKDKDLMDMLKGFAKIMGEAILADDNAPISLKATTKLTFMDDSVKKLLEFTRDNEVCEELNPKFQKIIDCVEEIEKNIDEILNYNQDTTVLKFKGE